MRRHKYKRGICLLFLLLMPMRASAEAISSLPPGDARISLAAPVTAASDDSPPVITKQAAEAAKLLGIEDSVQRLLALKRDKFKANNKERLKLELSIVRKIMTTGLELRAVSAHFDREIVVEQQASDKLSRQRDNAVAMTNNANFLQLGILSIVIDGPLEETRNRARILNGNRLNIVSGLTVGGLAAISLAEQRGGIRKRRPDPNLLGQTLGLDCPEGERLPSYLWTYLNSASPDTSDGLTRRERLINYWQNGKVLPVNIRKQSTMEQISAFGPRYRQWYESIKLINGRLTMLFDLRAMVDMLNTGLVELLQAVDE
ncbi:MAG TPA: hypothetical protein V6C86_18955 [Oculatellaceae cyanobacterium]